MIKATIVLEVIIDSIIAFTDYFIVRKHITLSEALLFLMGAARGFWPVFMGTSDLVTNGVLVSPIVSWLFVIITVFHLVSFFLSNLWYRIGAIGLAAMLWSALGLLLAESSFSSPAVPTFLILACTSAFIVIRLIRDRGPARIDFELAN